MKRIDATVELIIPDNTAFTVLTALRRLGDDQLTKVERADHFILSVSDDEPVDQVMRRLARAEVVFNPNKHRLSYAVEGAFQDAEPPEFEAIVRDREENNERLVSLLRGRFGMSTLQSLERGIGWRLFDERGPTSSERCEWACRVLLANPISQTYDIRRRPVRVIVGELTAAASNEAQ